MILLELKDVWQIQDFFLACYNAVVCFLGFNHIFFEYFQDLGFNLEGHIKKGTVEINMVILR